ncbi:MAG TPA: hypothetical protein VMY37_20355 [Thermoguttaceae bacterium]|nr:hypothetical protein [Thermoguttaceae bacterium]
MLDAPTIRGIQGEIALGRLSAGEIALRYGLPERTVREVRVGLRRPVRSADPQLIPRVLEAYADALTEPLGVLDEAPEPPEPGEEDLDLQGAGQRYEAVRAARLREIRAERARVTSRPV